MGSTFLVLPETLSVALSYKSGLFIVSRECNYVFLGDSYECVYTTIPIHICMCGGCYYYTSWLIYCRGLKNSPYHGPILPNTMMVA